MIRRNRYFLIGLVVVMALTAFMVRSLKAETLTPVQPGTDWTFIIVVVVIVALIGAGIYLVRKNPNEATKVSDVIAVELGRIRSLLEVKNAPPVLTDAVPEVKGRNGQAGIFTLQVTGDPAVDIPAMTAAYYKP